MSTQMASGAYRAIVTDNSSTTLQVQIPQLLGSAIIAARPCLPSGATALPAIGSTVWVIFEDGQARLPVWIGQLTPGLSTGAPPTSLTLVGTPGKNILQITGAQDTNIHTLMQISDYLGAPILWVNNTGGLLVTDNFSLKRGVFTQPNVFADIYGYLGHGDPLSMTYRHAGPPGNMLDMPTASGEIFDGTRLGSTGTWATGSGATGFHTVPTPAGPTISGIPFVPLANPSGMSNVIKMTQAFGTNLVARSALIGNFTNWTPCVANNYVTALASVLAVTTSRSITPFLVFCDASGATIAGTITGTAQTSVNNTWTQLVVNGTAPTGAHGVCLQLAASSMGIGEGHYLTANGIWVDTRTTSAANPNPEFVWSPPFTGSKDSSGAYTSVKTGDQYTRTDQVATSGKRIYMFDGTYGATYLPNQVGAPGSTAQPRWVSVA